MDFSTLTTGYETIVGFFSKLTDSVNTAPNFVELYQRVINSDDLDGSSSKDLIYQDVGITLDQLSRQIPFGNDNDVIKDYVDGVSNGSVSYYTFKDLLDAAIDSYRDPEHDHLVNIYSDPTDPEIIDTVDPTILFSALLENRNLLENTLTSVDNILAAAEGGIEDSSLILDRAVAGVSDDTKSTLREFLTQVLTSMEGRLTGSGLTAVVTAVLGFFHFDISTSNQESNIDGVFTNSSPAQAWFGEFIQWTADAGYNMSNWLAQHPFFMYEGIGYVIYGLYKLVKKGLTIASAFIGEWTIKSILGATGLTGAIQGSIATGDGTIGNAHCEYSIQFTNDTGIYTPAIANLLYDDKDQLGSAYTVFTPGSKRFYIKNGSHWTINVFFKMVNPFKIKKILDAHNIHLPYMFKPDRNGNGVGIIIPDPDYNLSSLTNDQWLQLWNDIAEEDLTYQDARINTNAAYAAAIFYAKFLDLFYMTLLSSKTEVSYIRPDQSETTVGGYDIAISMERYVSRTICVYNESGNFGNLWMMKFACRMFDNGYPNSYDYVSDFSETNGIIAETFNWGNYPNTGWYEIQLMPLVYLSRVKGTQGFWMSYLTRISNAKASFQVNNDSEVSWAAAKTLLTGVAVAAAVVASFVAFKYIPKLITYRRQLGMKLDTAAFNYGDKPSAESYQKYMSLYRRAKLLGVSTTAASSLLGDGKQFVEQVLNSQKAIGGEETYSHVMHVEKLIAG